MFRWGFYFEEFQVGGGVFILYFNFILKVYGHFGIRNSSLMKCLELVSICILVFLHPGLGVQAFSIKQILVSVLHAPMANLKFSSRFAH